jgi:hypothetical protein
MTPSGRAPVVGPLRDLLKSKAEEHAAALANRERVRDEARALDRQIQKLEAHMTALREMLSDAEPGAQRDKISVLRPGETSAVGESSLVGLPRVQAIEIILAESPGQELHRMDIHEALRSRGFPNERLGDTSAALAYLKRTRRVVNTARGYWRAA